MPGSGLQTGVLWLQVNVVVMQAVNNDEIADFVELTRHAPINVRFIEYMPFDGNVWSNSKMVSFKEMQEAVLQRFPQGLHRMQASGRGAVVHESLIKVLAASHPAGGFALLKGVSFTGIACVLHSRRWASLW